MPANRLFGMMCIPVAFAALLLITAQARAERAASIEYDVVGRPANLSPAFDAPAGATLSFLAIKAIDGYRVDAALWQPGDKVAAATTLLVGVHGSGGNFSRPPMNLVSPAMVAKGYGVLAINTRQHDEHVNTDNFLDVRRDIEA